MSIARAVLEYCADRKKLGAKTLFATHYHELTELENTLPGAVNYNIAVKTRGDDIIFLRKIVPGGADRSYGIEVAKLAGLPSNGAQPGPDGASGAGERTDRRHGPGRSGGTGRGTRCPWSPWRRRRCWTSSAAPSPTP